MDQIPVNGIRKGGLQERVDSCFNGLDALDYAAGADYDVIILDIMMPRMDGLEVVRRLRSGGNSTPVLFLTARDSVAA